MSPACSEMDFTGGNEHVAFFFDGLFAVFTYLSRIVSGRRRRQYGSNRSLVGHIGSLLPMQSLPRFCLGHKCQQSDVDSGDACSHYCCQEDDSRYVRSYSVRSSTPVKEDEDERILALQQEVRKLQSMVHELWTCHQATLSSDSEQTVIAVSCAFPASASLSRAQVAPQAPPPPPPPLPLALIPAQIVTSKSKATSLWPTECSGQTVPSLGNILKDIANVKLRPVERSPGGNPIKRPVTPSDPSNVLAAVLKKRFAAIHSATRTPEYRKNVSKGEELQFDINMKRTCKPTVVVQLFT